MQMSESTPKFKKASWVDYRLKNDFSNPVNEFSGNWLVFERIFVSFKLEVTTQAVSSDHQTRPKMTLTPSDLIFSSWHKTAEFTLQSIYLQIFTTLSACWLKQVIKGMGKTQLVLNYF